MISSHIIGLAETRLYQQDCSDQYQLNGFRLIRNDQAVDSAGLRPPHGLAVYVKKDVSISDEFSYTSKQLEFTLLNITHTLSKMQVVMLYKSPNMPDNRFLSVIEDQLVPHLITSEQLIVMGDFNIDVSKSDRRVIHKLCDRLVCNMLINQPTTDNQSSLDLIFSNVDGIVGTEETYWSDHKIICFNA